MTGTTSRPSHPNHLHGWVQQGVLWQLMENGTASPSQLARWLDCNLASVQRALTMLRDCALVQTTLAMPGGKRPAYGLTRPGIAKALRITQADWQGPGPIKQVPKQADQFIN